MTTPRPDYASSFRPGPMATAAPTATPSLPGSPGTTGSKLGGTLAGVDDLEGWTPTSEAEAHGAIASVGAYCRDYCPVRTACAEDACRLYRLEGRSAESLGYHRNAATEAVGVVGQPVSGLGL